MEDDKNCTTVKLCHGCEVSYLDSTQYSDDQVFNFLLEHGAIASSLKCPRCGSKIRSSSAGRLFHCCRKSVHLKKKKKKSKNRKCNFKQSVWTNTLFQRTKLPLTAMFRLVSATVCLNPPRELSIIEESPFITQQYKDWFLRIREVIIDAVSENSKKLGGKDQVVELIEAKWKTFKFNERLWDWAFGGIDRQSGETFFVPVEYHNFQCLRAIIHQKINPGTILVTNCIKSLSSEEIKELENSLSLSFVHPAFSTIASTIKYHWKEVRQGTTSLSKKRPPHSIQQMAEYLFKSKHPVVVERLHAFFVAAGRLYPPGLQVDDASSAMNNDDTSHSQ